jgi:prophage maintenance system killer protein
MKETEKGEVIIYNDQSGPGLQVQMDGETVWLTRAQMAILFGKDINTIALHISNVYREKELEGEKTSLKQANTSNPGIGLNKPTIYYNLDVIISVGYRVKSKRGTQFRIWATNRLRDYLLKGYAVNQQRLKELKEKHNLQMKELQQTAKLFQNVIEAQRAGGYEKELLSIITDYANTWAVLNLYDKGQLGLENVSKQKSKTLDYEEVKKSIAKFKERLGIKKEAGGLFGQEVGGKFQGVLGSIGQTFSGKDLYPSIEEKAAHLLYFCIKDHPFADGNKRIGSLLFLLFLVQNNFLLNKKGERKINDTALAALALLVAESKPVDKDVMVKLVVNLINRK